MKYYGISISGTSENNFEIKNKTKQKNSWALNYYPKIPLISPGLKFVQKAFSLGLYSGGAYYRRGLLLEGVLGFKMDWSLQ